MEAKEAKNLLTKSGLSERKAEQIAENLAMNINEQNNRSKKKKVVETSIQEVVEDK